MSVVANVAINVDSRGAVGQLKAVQQGAVATDRAVSGLLKTVGKLTIALGAMQAVKFVFAKTAELESQTRSLEVLTGSAIKAKQIIQELQQLGAVTPFTSTELIDAAKRLQAFGVETEKVVQTTRRLADVSGATGAELQGLVTAYGQVQAKGRLQGEELLQFQERGVALQGELQKMYGLSGEELRKALEKGRIGAEAVEVAINRLTEKGGKYANGAIAQSSTLAGKFSTLMDSIEMLAKNVGKVLEPALKRILDLSITVIDKINEAMAGPDKKTANNELFNTRAEVKKLTAEIKAAEKAGIGMSKGLEIKGIDDNVLIPSAPVLPIMKAELTDLTKKATYLEGRLKELNKPKATKEDVNLKIPQLLEEKGAADKAAKEAEKAAKLAQKLAEDSAQYQIQIDDQIFKNQVELDKMRYDLQRQLQEKQLSNFVNKFTGAAKEQAGIIQSMVMGSASFDAQIKDIENKIKEAQQRLQSGARMNQVQSTTVGAGGGFLVGSTGRSSGPHLDIRGSDREGVIKEAAAIIKVWQKQGLPYIELPNAKINVKNMLNELQLLQALRKEQMAHDVTRGRPVGASGNAVDISVPSGTKVPVAAGAASFQGFAGYAATSLATGNRMLHGLPQSKAGGGGVAGGVPGENVDQTKAEIQGLMQQLALLKSQSKSLKAEDLTAGILASTSAFREQTAQLGMQTEAFTLRNRLQMEGVKPELIEGELKLLEVRQQLNDRLKPFNELLANGTMTQEQYAQATDGIKVAAENAAIAIQTYTAATAAASSPIQQFIGSAQTQLKDLESVAVRVSQGIGDAVGNSLTKGVQGLIEGTATAQQVFADFLKTVGDILMQEGTKMIATYTAIAIAKSLAGLFGGGGGGLPSFGDGGGFGSFEGGALGTASGGLGGGDFTSFLPGKSFYKAAGGPVSGNSTYMVGEKGPELFVPSAAGTIIPAGPTAGIREAMANGNGQSNASPVLNMSFESSTINGVEYVSRDQLETAMMETRRQASRDGAKRGMTMTLDRLQQSPSTRSRVGLG